jgi:hypothetical protein
MTNWKEEFMVEFQVLSWYFPEENHEYSSVRVVGGPVVFVMELHCVFYEVVAEVSNDI